MINLTREQLGAMAKTNANPTYLDFRQIAKTALALWGEKDEAIKRAEKAETAYVALRVKVDTLKILGRCEFGE